MKFYALNGILFTMVAVLTKGYAIKFLDRLGGGDLHYSLYNALPGFIAIFTTIPGILLIQRGKSKKNTLGFFFYLSRTLPLLLACVPLLDEKWRPMVFVLIYGIMNFPESISATSLQDYTADVFSHRERADALSLRNQLSQIAQISISILAGFVLSLSNNNEVVIYIYQGFIIISFLIGLKEISYMKKLKIKDTPLRNNKKVQAKFKSTVSGVFKQKDFTLFLMCSLVFHFGWQMGWPLFNVYQIKFLGANEMWLTIINAFSSLAMVFSFIYWKKFIKKHDYKLAVTFAAFGMGLTPILYRFSPNLTIITLIQPITGFFTAGITVAILGSLLASTKEEHRTMSIAIHATLTSVTLAIAPLVGTFVQGLLGIDNALLFSAGLRILGSGLFLYRYILSIKMVKSKKKNHSIFLKIKRQVA
ncbi:MAG: MFS transporter [Clostridium sp.]|nr:MFS transporter [Clostridium sp.]